MALRKILTRDFVLGFFAQLAFSSVFFILIPTIPIYLQQLGTTEAGIGVLVGALSVSSLVLRPFIGRALLKGGEKNFMWEWGRWFLRCITHSVGNGPILPKTRFMLDVLTPN